MSYIWTSLSYTVQTQLCAHCCVDSTVACCHNLLIWTVKKYLTELQYTIFSSLRKIPWIAGSNTEQEYLQEKEALWVLKNKRKKENRRHIEMSPGLVWIIMTCCRAVLHIQIKCALHNAVCRNRAILDNISPFKKEQKIPKGSALGKLPHTDLITSLSLDWMVDPKVDKAGSRKTENSPSLPLSLSPSGKKCH